MTRTTHPIDHAIVAFLFLVEGVCWIINELAGFHAEPEAIDPRDVYAIEADVSTYDEPLPFDATFEGGSHDLDWDEYVDDFAAIDAYNELKRRTVKQLRKQAQGLAKGVHLMRKAELLTLLAA